MIIDVNLLVAAARADRLPHAKAKYDAERLYYGKYGIVKRHVKCPIYGLLQRI